MKKKLANSVWFMGTVVVLGLVLGGWLVVCVARVTGHWIAWLVSLLGLVAAWWITYRNLEGIWSALSMGVLLGTLGHSFFPWIYALPGALMGFWLLIAVIDRLLNRASKAIAAGDHPKDPTRIG